MLPRRIRTISTNTASFGPYKTSTRSVTILASPSLIPGIGTIGPIMDSAVKIVSAITENIASAVIFLISILFAFSAVFLLSFFFVSIFVYSFFLKKSDSCHIYTSYVPHGDSIASSMSAHQIHHPFLLVPP